MNIYLGICLPILLEIPPTLSQNKGRHGTDFFVRKPQYLEPRRPVESEEQKCRTETEESMEPNKRRRNEEEKERLFSKDLHRERKRLNTNTTYSSWEDEMIESLENRSFGEMESPRAARNPQDQQDSNESRNPQDQQDSDESWDFETLPDPPQAAASKSIKVQVQVHGSMSQI